MADTHTETPAPTPATTATAVAEAAAPPIEKKVEMPGVTGEPVAVLEKVVAPKSKDAPELKESSAPVPASEAEGEITEGKTKKGSRFFKLHGGGDLLKETWGDNDFCCALEQMVPKDKIKKKSGGLEFELENGHKIAWQTRPDGQEFIGFNKSIFKQSFDESDAKAIILAAAARGWGEVNLHGDAQAKGMLWLEAQRMGLKVTNFSPGPGSEYMKIWEAENETGATKNGDKPVPKSEHKHGTEVADTPPPTEKAETPSKFRIPAEGVVATAAPAAALPEIDATEAFLREIGADYKKNSDGTFEARDLRISETELRRIPDLSKVSVQGSMIVENNKALYLMEDEHMPREIKGDLIIRNNEKLNGIEVPADARIGGNAVIRDNPNLATFGLGAETGGNVEISGNSSVGLALLPRKIGGDLLLRGDISNVSETSIGGKATLDLGSEAQNQKASQSITSTTKAPDAPKVSGAPVRKGSAAPKP